VGHRDAPGRPAMYGTTRQFLDHFNLKTLDQLPELSELSEVSSQHPELAFEAEPEANGAQSGAEQDVQSHEVAAAGADSAPDAPVHEQSGEPRTVEVEVAGADGDMDTVEAGAEEQTDDGSESAADIEEEAGSNEASAASDAEDDACTRVS
ncbi:MAG: SMC-Scp complex subunit ScpB, partial [Halofilum sp. (in: g-proteobacteria)]